MLQWQDTVFQECGNNKQYVELGSLGRCKAAYAENHSGYSGQRLPLHAIWQRS